MITKTRQPTTTRRTETHCPVCGGLECLCRPRFFAGQLLTEEDLNRLENYVIGKNKLHNRYLHGWGVACGLEVLCNPCDGYVTVKSGYALSPCGDDIVVCQDTSVNVCDLISRCRTQKEWDCDPAWPNPNPICGDQDQQWVLYICYDEKPARGITPLRGSTSAPCCSRCSGGGSSSCGCGCHEPSASAKSGCRSPQPKTPAQCEPTVTCEGYTFQLRKLGIQETGNPGVLVATIQECLAALSKIQVLLNELPSSQHRLQDVLAIRDELIRLLEEHGLYDCKLYDRIIHSPLPDAATPIDVVQQHFRAIVREMFQACLCSALLPACPPPAEDNCVPIATLTINCKGGGCHIVKVCNWEHRRLVIGFPTLEYWFGALLTQSNLPQILEKLCCEPIRIPSTLTGAGTPNDPAAANPNPNSKVDASLGNGTVDDLVSNLFDDAVSNQGSVKRSKVYGYLAGIVRTLAEKLFSDK
jgi:hypothetical protein